MGRRRKNDSGAEGVLLVDKPEGPSSHDVVGQARRALGTGRIGHAGTLDPLASGLLVLLVGRYTRLSNHLTGADKDYEALVRFGSRTTTDDREGDAVETGDPSQLTRAQVEAALAEMVGPISQVPPSFSAISVGGERLYAKARRGEAVEAPARDVVLHALELTDWDSPDARVRAFVSKGTYVRSIARDLGARLGVPAHLGGLRRTRSGAYSVDEAVVPDAIDAAVLLQGPAAVRGMAHVEVDDDAAARLKQGQLAPFTGALQTEPALATHAGELLALVRQDGSSLRVSRGLWAG